VIHVVGAPEAEVPERLRRQVLAAQEEAWPSDDGGASVTSLAVVHDLALHPYSLLLVDAGDNVVLSALDLLFKRIEHAGQQWDAAGLSTVVTPLAYRGRGYGRRLVTDACARLPGMGVDLALFTCDRPLAAFYESCGFEVLPGTVLEGGTAQEPFASDQPGFDKVALSAFFTARAQAVRTDFVNTTVRLHSGTIDKLW
jgi:aminoglycoside 2'-N-acetyltransferase I